MRLGSLASYLLAATVGCLTWAAPALAAPVYVTPRLDNVSIGPDLAIVAFSFDVKKLFPIIESRFEQWRPVPSSSLGRTDKILPTVPTWKNFHLVHAVQLQDYREAFMKAHGADKEAVKLLMPRFDAVFRKYGDRQPEQSPSDVLATEDARQAWCTNVTRDLNAIIASYNRGLGGGAAADATYRELYARWLGKRNEALRQAVSKSGANPDFGFVESSTNENGLAVFDLPPGRWYIACQLEAISWYKPVIVPEGGGRVILRQEESTHESLKIAEWLGN